MTIIGSIARTMHSTSVRHMTLFFIMNILTFLVVAAKKIAAYGLAMRPYAALCA